MRNAQQRERSGRPSETGAASTRATISGLFSIASTPWLKPLACQYSSGFTGISGISQPNFAGSGFSALGFRGGGEALAPGLTVRWRGL
jgi:hypothetical protein